jgi:DNA-binding transcriptional ArsR family regulator
LAISIFPELADFRKPDSCHGRSAFRATCFQAGCAATPEALLLAYIPIRFDLYRALKPHLRWTLQCLVGFADRDGRCWPSIRKLAEVSGISKSSVSRHLAELTGAGYVSRHRRPSGVYTYRIDSRFLPAFQAASALSRRRDPGVPPVRTEENPFKKIAAFGDRFGDSLDDRPQWEARIRSWQRSRFWLPFWGPKPDQPHNWVPPSLLSAGKNPMP